MGEVGCDSAPGELSEEDKAQAGALAAGSRRGAASLRDRTRDAFEAAHFPTYPLDDVAEVPFALPDGMLDKDAPQSAVKWCGSASSARAAEQRALRHATLCARLAAARG